MGSLIEVCRKEILKLWDICLIPIHERQTMKAMDIPDDMYNDNVLTEHEKILDSLRSRHEEILPILKLIRKRDLLLEKRIEYDSIISDSSRLLSRAGGKR